MALVGRGGVVLDGVALCGGQVHAIQIHKKRQNGVFLRKNPKNQGCKIRKTEQICTEKPGITVNRQEKISN